MLAARVARISKMMIRTRTKIASEQVRLPGSLKRTHLVEKI